jgi:hypothetical protein
MAQATIEFDDVDDLPDSLLPVDTRVLDVLDENNGQVRLGDLLEDVGDVDRDDVAVALVDLVDDGNLSLLSVGEKTVIRSEE